MLCLALTASGTTYYIDFNSGDDTKAGTSQGTAWKTIPGSRNAADTADAQTQWGPGPTFSASSLVPGGTTFMLKPGTTNLTGPIYISKDSVSAPPVARTPYYASSVSTNSQLTFRRDITWGSGSVYFNGAGTSVADTNNTGQFYIRNLGGVVIDGVSGVTDPYDGIVIENTPDRVIFFWLATAGQGGGSGIGGITMQYVKMFNCGTLISHLQAAFESHYVITLTMDTLIADPGGTIDGIFLNNLEINCNGLYTGGIRVGEQPGRGTGFIHDVLIYNSGTGDTSDIYKNARGITTKSSLFIISNAITHNMEKGQDHSCPLFYADTPWLMGVTNYNPLSYSNEIMGMGQNGPYGASGSTIFTNVANFWTINGIFTNNGGPGIKFYGKPANVGIVNTDLAWNKDNFQEASDINDTNFLNLYFYNDIFYKFYPPNVHIDGNLNVGYWMDTNTTFHITSDYNSYVATNSSDAAECWFTWSAFNGSLNLYQFLYGANGPGQTSGSWYTFHSFHNDAHSRGTGSAFDSSSPPFADITLVLTNHYAGTNLSSMPWYLAGMGVDRKGNPRVSWDIGAFEFIPGFTPHASYGQCALGIGSQ